MLDEKHLLTVCSIYSAATEVEEKTLSFRIFADSKRLTALRTGGAKSITIRKYRDAMQWLSANWPKDAKWPKGIERPKHRAAAQ